MVKTKNLGLNLTEDEEIKFGVWRKSIDGNNDDGEKSNMQIIDEAFGKVDSKISELGFESLDFTPINILDGVTLTYTTGATIGTDGNVLTTQYTTNYTAINEKIDVIAGCTYKIPSYIGVARYLYEDGTVSGLIEFVDGKPADREIIIPDGVNKLALAYIHNRCNFLGIIYRITPTAEEKAELPIKNENLEILPQNLQNKNVQDFIRELSPDNALIPDESAFIPPNILDGRTLNSVEGSTWGGGGNIVNNQYTSNLSAVSEKIEVVPGCTYRIPKFNGNIMFFDEYGVNGEQIAQSKYPITEFVFAVPDGKVTMGIAYVTKDMSIPTEIYRETMTSDERNSLPIKNEKLSILPENISRKDTISLIAPLKSKTIVNFGDSIFGNYESPEDISTRLAEFTGATVYNCGFGGSRLASHPTSYFDAFSMYRLAEAVATNDYTLQDQAIIDGTAEQSSVSIFVTKYPTRLALLKTIDFNKVDIITIAYGTNDWQGKVAVDNESNKYDTNYIAGALRYSIEKLLTKYPHLKVFICCPIYRCWNNTDGTLDYDSDDASSAVNGVLLTDIVSKEEAVAKEYHLPFIDNYYELGINRFNRLNFFTVSDGTHPNQEGRKRIAEHIAMELF